MLHGASTLKARALKEVRTRNVVVLVVIVAMEVLIVASAGKKISVDRKAESLFLFPTLLLICSLCYHGDVKSMKYLGY